MTVMHQADIELIARDPALPGLGCVLDPQRLVAVLGEQEHATPIDDIQLSYVRYKPGMDCLGRYTLSVGGCQHLAYAKTFGKDAEPKLAKAGARVGVVGPNGAGRVTVPEQALLFSWFPNDRKLRSLERLASESARNRLIERVFKDDSSWLGSSYEVLNYKPEKRLVCRLDNSAGRRATVKFYSPMEFRHTVHLRRNRTFPAPLAVPRYIGGSKKHCVHAFEWLPGRNLRELSLDPAGDTVHHRQAGRLLADLHACRPGALARGDGRAMAAAARSIARLLTHILPETGADADACARRLGRFVEDSQRNEGPVHADFYDKQIIVGPAQLALIDLDRARLGSTVEDLGCFIAHLERLGICTPGLDGSRVRALSLSLLDGYLEAEGHYAEHELAGWTAFSLFSLSPEPFRDRLPEWPERIREMLARTRSVLAAAGLCC
jgi:hypothetical protein